MNTSGKSSDQTRDADQSSQDWLFNSFGEPRTMPTGWDLSGMNGSRKAVHASGAGEPAAENPEHEESLPGPHLQYLNPFPEPRAYPVYWDLCR